MDSLFSRAQRISSDECISLTKAWITEIQRLFLEEFYASSISKGWILIGGANLKFLYNQKRHTKDIDFAGNKETFEQVNDVIEALKVIEHTLEKRAGYPVSIKPSEGKTAVKVFVSCPEIGGVTSFDIEFTNFEVILPPEKAQIGQTLVLGSKLKEMKVNKILSLVLRKKLAHRDIFDLFINPEPIDPSLLDRYLHRYKKKKIDLKKKISLIKRNIHEFNLRLLEVLKEDLGLEETKRYISSSKDTSLLERVLREIEAAI